MKTILAALTMTVLMAAAAAGQGDWLPVIYGTSSGTVSVLNEALCTLDGFCVQGVSTNANAVTVTASNALGDCQHTLMSETLRDGTNTTAQINLERYLGTGDEIKITGGTATAVYRYAIWRKAPQR